ncbi:MAG: hypothetical protein L6R37_005773 [Teloschistes peruensis]|nr:MAG: hypothetical protein L6R37_005773 [Teloschistes peruensis]
MSAQENPPPPASVKTEPDSDPTSSSSIPMPSNSQPTTQSQSQSLTQTQNPLDPSYLEDTDPIDAEIDLKIAASPRSSSHAPAAATNMNIDGAGDDRPDVVEEESRLPMQKDITLQEFLSQMDDYAPIIPDAVTTHHLLLAGLPPTTTPTALSRLLALATQKFVADIAADAYQYSRMRAGTTAVATTATATTASGPGAPPTANAAGGDGAGTGGGGGGGGGKVGKAGAHVLGQPRAGYGGGGGGSGGRAVLTMEDLGCAVGEYGVSVRRGEFYR